MTKRLGKLGWLTTALAIAAATVALAAPASVAEQGGSSVPGRLDLSAAVDRSTTFDAASPTPGDTGDGIGPGSPLVITIPDAGTFGCTANYVWRSGGALYLGAAGHCFIGDPEDETASRTELAGVEVEVCVAACYFGGLASQVIAGEMVALGEVVYARQARGDEQLGEDFGLVAIPAEHAQLVRPSMPVWGGPTGSTEVSSGDIVCSYGNGLGVGETVATKARLGLGATTDGGAWYATYPGNLGDSGSAVNICVDGVGADAIGVLTHVTVGVDGGPITAGGTTVARAMALAAEGGLTVCLVLESGDCTGDGGGGSQPDAAPVATFTSSCTATACSFDGGGSSDSDGDVVAYAWDFGDGASGSGSQVEHTYVPDGKRKKASYQVTLTVTDDAGGTGTAQRRVTCTKDGSTYTCA